MGMSQMCTGAGDYFRPQNPTQRSCEKYLIMPLPHVSCAGDNQGQPTFTSLYRAVCGQLLPRQAGGGGRLLVDAVRGSCGVHQDDGLT